MIPQMQTTATDSNPSNGQQAIGLAIRFLEAFQDAGGIYDDYLAAENVTDDEYHVMLNELRAILVREVEQTKAQELKKGPS